MRALPLIAALTLAAAAPADEPRPKPGPFELRDGDRVVLLGNSLIEREQKHGYWEAMLTARYPELNVTFRNLGWDGDTVWAESRGIFDPPQVGYNRMIEQIRGLKPTVIFLGYGNNEAFAGPDGLPSFVRQYEKLLDDLTAVAETDVRFVLLSPMLVERASPRHPDPEFINRNTSTYADAIREIAARRGGWFVDFRESERSLQLKEPAGGGVATTENGLLRTGAGYRRLGIELSFQLLGPDLPARAKLSAAGEALDQKRLGVSHVKATPDRLAFTVRLDALFNSSKEARTSADLGEPLIEAQGLPKGTWALHIDGVEIARGTSAEWERGEAQRDRMTAHPDAAQARRLREAIVAKNELYFHSWRPQNVTYLFGFRKHEQGQNAKETAEFEKLVAEKEAEVARLRKPVQREYVLSRVTP